MRRILTIVLTAGSLWVAGCDGFGQPVETRINEAFPVAESVAKSRNALDAFVQESDIDAIDGIASEMESKLKIRALSCSKGYQPGMFESHEAIRAAVANPDCFAEFDRTLTSWLNLRHIEAMLSAGPLRPIPQNVPEFVTAAGRVGLTSFADQAGVVLFTYSGDVEILDLNDGSPIYAESNASRAGQSSGRLSPNGRLFVTGRQGTLSIRDSQTGEVLADYDDVGGFHWLDGRTALMTGRNDPRAPQLLDFATGERTAMRGIEDGLLKVIPAPSDGEYVAFTHRSLVRIALERSGGKVSARIVDDEPLESPVAWADNTGAYSADYERYVSGSSGISIVTLDPLDVQSINLDSFLVQSALPTPLPDLLLVTGFFKDAQAAGVQTFAISIADLTIAPLTEAPQTARYVYLPSIDRIGVISQSRMELRKQLPLGAFVSFDAFAESVRAEANLRQLDSFQRGSGISGGIPEGLPVPEWARDAEVAAVGVYESTAGEHGFGKTSRAGPVTIRVRRAATPVILVLASYEPVQWRIEPDPGARIAAILLGGYHQSQVSGVDDVRQIDIGRVYAYEQGGDGFAKLEVAVARLTGKRIRNFQGRYSGESFSVDTR